MFTTGFLVVFIFTIDHLLNLFGFVETTSGGGVDKDLETVNAELAVGLKGTQVDVPTFCHVSVPSFVKVDGSLSVVHVLGVDDGGA